MVKTLGKGDSHIVRAGTKRATSDAQGPSILNLSMAVRRIVEGCGDAFAGTEEPAASDATEPFQRRDT
ncbi:hypothetical protein [Corynebacterium kroppenstedtii]|uniref:hypothetical protein n=1 Tax=Corynebacterium kroppenstedtii TaxID=161879 RepID=UPI0038732B1D